MTCLRLMFPPSARSLGVASVSVVAVPKVSYNTAIAACDKLRDAEAAVRLLQQARENDIVPDLFSYNTVISALGHSSLWQVG